MRTSGGGRWAVGSSLPGCEGGRLGLAASIEASSIGLGAIMARASWPPAWRRRRPSLRLGRWAEGPPRPPRTHHAATHSYAVLTTGRYVLYDAAKFAVGLSSLGVVNISGFFLRGPPPTAPQSVIKWQLANPPSFWLSNAPNKFTNPNPAKSHISQNRQRAARAGGLWPSPAAPGRRCVYSGGRLHRRSKATVSLR